MFQAHDGPVAAVRFDPADPSRLWTAGWDGRLRCWSLRDGPGGVKARRLADHTLGALEATDLALTGDGARLLTATFAGDVRLWTLGKRPKKATSVEVARRPNAEWVRQLALDPAGRWAVAVAPAESALIVVDLAASPTARVLPQPQVPATVAFLDADRVAVGRFDGSMAPLDLKERAR